MDPKVSWEGDIEHHLIGLIGHHLMESLFILYTHSWLIFSISTIYTFPRLPNTKREEVFEPQHPTQKTFHLSRYDWKTSAYSIHDWYSIIFQLSSQITSILIILVLFRKLLFFHVFLQVSVKKIHFSEVPREADIFIPLSFPPNSWGLRVAVLWGKLRGQRWKSHEFWGFFGEGKWSHEAFPPWRIPWDERCLFYRLIYHLQQQLFVGKYNHTWMVLGSFLRAYFTEIFVGLKTFIFFMGCWGSKVQRYLLFNIFDTDCIRCITTWLMIWVPRIPDIESWPSRGIMTVNNALHRYTLVN